MSNFLVRATSNVTAEKSYDSLSDWKAAVFKKSGSKVKKESTSKKIVRYIALDNGRIFGFFHVDNTESGDGNSGDGVINH